MDDASEGELTNAVGRVLLLSSDGPWAMCLGRALRLDGFAVGLVRQVEELDGALADIDPEIVMVDGGPEQRLDGLCTAVRSVSEALVFALGCSDAEVVAATASGADAFALRSTSERVLIARVRALLRRHGRVELDLRVSEVLAVGSLKVVTAENAITGGEHEIVIDAVSHKILAALLKRPGAVVPRAHLLREIGQSMDGGPALDLAVRRLRDQLEPYTGRGSIAAVRGVGFRYVDALREQSTALVGSAG